MTWSLTATFTTTDNYQKSYTSVLRLSNYQYIKSSQSLKYYYYYYIILLKSFGFHQPKENVKRGCGKNSTKKVFRMFEPGKNPTVMVIQFSIFLNSNMFCVICLFLIYLQWLIYRLQLAIVKLLFEINISLPTICLSCYNNNML